jgi:acetyltransferase-like isoleucine patch superfamily enzyme
MAYDESEITGEWDYSTLPSNVWIGKDCWIERRDSFSRFRSTCQPGLVLGDRIHIYTWTTFNVEPTGCIEVGDDSTLVGAVFMCAERIQLGRNVVISYHVTIADSDFHPIDPTMRMQDAIANRPHGNRIERPCVESRPITIEDDVWVGIGAIILKGVRIGRGAKVGAGAVVTRDVPDGATIEGNPARVGTLQFTTDAAQP